MAGFGEGGRSCFARCASLHLGREGIGEVVRVQTERSRGKPVSRVTGWRWQSYIVDFTRSYLCTSCGSAPHLRCPKSKMLPPHLPTTHPHLPSGFHTFDYARHFLSCCSRMLGLEHETSRGSITIDYYGRSVGLKIMPTGKRREEL